MKVNKAKLIQAFDAVIPGLATRDVLTQARSFIFYGGRLFTYNDKVAVSVDMPEGWEFEGAVKASELHRVIKKMDAEEVEVTVEEGTLVISCGRTRVEAKTEADYQRYHEQMGLPGKWLAIPPPVIGALRRGVTCASKSFARPILMFIHVKGDRVSSTDNFRLLVSTLKGVKMPEFLVPAAIISDITTFKCTHIGRSEGWIHFKNEQEAVYSARTMTGDYPDLGALMNIEGDHLEFPAGLTVALDRAMEALDPKAIHPAVEIAVKNNVMQLVGSGPFTTVRERFKVVFDGSTSFVINPSLLQDAIKLAASCTVGERMIAIGDEKLGFQHVIALQVGRKEAPAEEAPAEEDEKPAKKTAAKKGATKTKATVPADEAGW